MAGKIKKLLENELVGGTQSDDVYPITSTMAVYDEDNERLDGVIRRKGIINISTNYNSGHIAEVLTLEQAIAKVPSKDRVLGFQGRFLTSDGWKSYIFDGDSLSNWSNVSNWIELISSAGLAQELGNNISKAVSQKAVTNVINTINENITELNSKTGVYFTDNNRNANIFIKELYIPDDYQDSYKLRIRDCINPFLMSNNFINFSLGDVNTEDEHSGSTNGYKIYKALSTLDDLDNVIEIPGIGDFKGKTAYVLLNFKAAWKANNVESANLTFLSYINKDICLNLANSPTIREYLYKKNYDITPQYDSIKPVTSSGIRTALDDATSEINISKIFPSNGIDGTNKYTLETAINLIPDTLKFSGIKCSFINNNEITESWEYTSGTFTDISNWTKIGAEEIKQLQTAKSLSYNDNISEYIYIITDSENNILFYIKGDGKVGFPKVDDAIINIINNEINKYSVINTQSISDKDTDPEFMYKILDSEGYVLFGIKYDGSIYSPKLNINDIATREEIENIKKELDLKVYSSNLLDSIESIRTQMVTSDTSISNSLSTLSSSITSIIRQLNVIQCKSKFLGMFSNEELLPQGEKGNYAYVTIDNEIYVYIYDSNSDSFKNSNIKIELNIDKDNNDNVLFSPSINPIIYINNQLEFDNLQTILNTSINDASKEEVSTVNILLKNGVYKFKETITSDGITKKENELLQVNISSAIGEKAIIISDGDEYTPNDAIDFTPTHYICKRKSPYVFGEAYINQDFDKIETCDTGRITSCGMNVLDNLIHIQVSNGTSDIWIEDNSAAPSGYNATNLCRLVIPDELYYIKNKDAEYFSNSILFNPGWFNLYVHKINYSDDTYLYFTASNNSYSNSYKWDVNCDYSFGKIMPSIFITNILEAIEPDTICTHTINEEQYIYIPLNITKLYICTNDRFLNINGLKLAKFNISNLKFVGSKDYDFSGDSATYSSYMNFHDCKNVEIINNTYISTGSSVVINATSTHSNYSIDDPSSEINQGIGLIILRNYFKNLAGFAIVSSMEDTNIRYNKVENSGLFKKFQGTIEVSAKNFYIADNITINQSYAGIRIGDTRKAAHNISGVLERNLIYNMQNHQFKYLRTTTMDGGGIYIFTHNDDTICRYNIIHDIKGKASYRGIFCDDGAYNFTIYGNLIYNIENYTIDSRRVSWKDSNSNTIGQPLNVNNNIGHNILFGDYKFQGCSDLSEGESTKYETNQCIKTKNLICKRTSYQVTETILSNLESEEADVKDYDSYIEGDKIYITQNIKDWNIDSFIYNKIFNFLKD